MSAKDAFHEVVKTALQKDGWQITHDPYNLPKKLGLKPRPYRTDLIQQSMNNC